MLVSANPADLRSGYQRLSSSNAVARQSAELALAEHSAQLIKAIKGPLPISSI